MNISTAPEESFLVISNSEHNLWNQAANRVFLSCPQGKSRGKFFFPLSHSPRHLDSLKFNWLRLLMLRHALMHKLDLTDAKLS